MEKKNTVALSYQATSIIMWQVNLKIHRQEKKNSANKMQNENDEKLFPRG